MTSVEYDIVSALDAYRKVPSESLKTGKFHNMANDLNYSQ